MFGEKEINNKEQESENLENLADVSEDFIEQKEFSVEEKVDNALENQNESLNQRESKHNKNILTGLRKWVGVTAVMGASLLAVGCNAEKPSSSDINQQKMESVDNIEFQQNKDFLKGVFNGISGGGLAKSEKGNLVVHTGGGKYYELENEDLKELTDYAGTQREKLERLQKTENGKKAAIMMKDGINILIKGKIEKIGDRLNGENLPDGLQEFEKARVETIKEMQR